MQRAAGADKARCDRGEKPRNFSCKAAEEFAHAPGGTTKGLPERTKERDRSTKGSPPFSNAELAAGYRRIGRA
jgi:hypothetical protein